MERERENRSFLDRREVLVIVASGAFSLLGFAKARSLAAPSRRRILRVTPPVTEGPYFVDERLLRSDIRTDPNTGVAQSGLPVTLTINLSRLENDTLSPLTGAYVDIWHANVRGVYSDISQNGTAGQRFLRGSQVADSAGKVQFVTI